jgi:hypothetical protein
MLLNQKYFFAGTAIMLILLVMWWGYERYSVVSCTSYTKEKAKNLSSSEMTIREYEGYYKLVYAACMGEKGFER